MQGPHAEPALPATGDPTARAGHGPIRVLLMGAQSSSAMSKGVKAWRKAWAAAASSSFPIWQLLQSARPGIPRTASLASTSLRGGAQQQVWASPSLRGCEPSSLHKAHREEGPPHPFDSYSPGLTAARVPHGRKRRGGAWPREAAAPLKANAAPAPLTHNGQGEKATRLFLPPSLLPHGPLRGSAVAAPGPPTETNLPNCKGKCLPMRWKSFSPVSSST